jgi:DNA-binding MarR family transcriptional regulator
LDRITETFGLTYAGLKLIIQVLIFEDPMETLNYSQHDLTILEQIEQDPDANQATLASQLGVAVGTINWHLKRLVEKGFVKVRRLERKKLRYIITPEGIALRARLTVDYIQTSFRMYRLVRLRMMDVIQQLHTAGYDHVRLNGDGDIADICRLTCLEQGITVDNNPNAPVLQLVGLKIFIEMPLKAAVKTMEVSIH